VSHPYQYETLEMARRLSQDWGKKTVVTIQGGRESEAGDIGGVLTTLREVEVALHALPESPEVVRSPTPSFQEGCLEGSRGQCKSRSNLGASRTRQNAT
jgi:hypothetical protein